MWKNIVELGGQKMIKGHMRIAGCIAKATDTHSEYVTLIAFSTATMVA
jgi:predicted enzyme related to lactoylglutathione lyase